MKRIRQAVKELNDFFISNHLTTCDTLNIQSLAKMFDVHVVFYPDESCFLKIKQGGRQLSLISIDERLTEFEKYEVFCHELAHFLLKHKQEKSYLPFLINEMTADKLALHIAIPNYLIIDIDISSETVIADISETFGVSLAFATERLELLFSDMTNRKFRIDKEYVSNYKMWLSEEILNFGGTA